MTGGRMRSTRKLRNWIVDQVSSGKFPGVMWDDEAKTMFRIPWKHAGKQDFRKDEDAAIFKAWAEFKGKLSDGGGQDNPASWKTRLRCALNKSPEFSEVMERAQLDISEPYKVYRLVPTNEQGMIVPEKKCKVKTTRKRRSRARKRRSSSSEEEEEEEEQEEEQEEEEELAKRIKTEEVTSQLSGDPDLLRADISFLTEEPIQFNTDIQRDVDEIMLGVTIEENVPAPEEVHDSFLVKVHYLGQEVLRHQIQGSDARIMYLPRSPVAPTPAVLKERFPRIRLPEPPSTLPAGPELNALCTLLPFMQKGVVLTSTPQGVYGKRLCQGRVFWTGPHTTTPGLHKMERNTQSVLLFSKDTYKQQLEQFRAHGGEAPHCSVTLCFGEELSHTEDPSEKLIIVQITFPWAEQEIQTARSFHESISILQTLASQSPFGEITLNLVTVPSPMP